MRFLMFYDCLYLDWVCRSDLGIVFVCISDFRIVFVCRSDFGVVFDKRRVLNVCVLYL